MNNITQLLLDTQDQDFSIRSAAEGSLKKLQELDYPHFLLSLSMELSRDESPPESRRVAGSFLKNSVEGKDSMDNQLNIKRWINLDQPIKSEIKGYLLTTLGSSAAEARHTSSQIIGSLACVEIPRHNWQDLIGKLLGNMAQPGASPQLKQATLETLGYVFEELKQDEIDDVLYAVIQAMNRGEQSSEVRLAAVETLKKGLMFTNFANADCRTHIMTAICDAAKSGEPERMKQGAFCCLTAIAPEYYMVLEPYMETIISLTTEALEGGVETVALQCIDFWRTICQEVIELQEEKKRFAHAKSNPDNHFIEKPLCSLVPVLLGTLLNQVGDGDALKCLGLVAKTIGDAIVPLAMQFVEAHIKMADWWSRKAATSAIGVILEVPCTEKLAPVVDLLMDMMGDSNMEVRGTALFTLGRLFELLHSPALGKRFFTGENFSRIMAVLSKSGKDVPEVSEEVCGAIYLLARGYQPISSEVAHSKRKISSELSPFLSDVISVLLSASELDKVNPFRLPASASAYKALNEVVRVSNIYDYEASRAIVVLMPRIMRRLNTALDAKATSSDNKSNKYKLQALLCDTLCVIILKLGNSSLLAEDTVKESAKFVLLLFCRVLTCDCSTAHDKAALAIGALARVIGSKFVDHMYLFLQYFDVKLLSPIYLQVIGDIFRVLGHEILPFCDYMMVVLYKGLSKRTLKPHILACFGEIALAMGTDFEEYLQPVMKKLKAAANPKYYANVFDEDKVEYGNQLRQGIFKAYSGILKGIKDPKCGFKVAVHLVEFIEAVSKDESRGASVTFTAVDVLSEFGLTMESWKDGLISEVRKY